MDHVQTYKNFINGRFVSEGLKTTAGIVIPSLVSLYFNALPIGLLMSLGALCTSVPDFPGPVHHRANSMIATVIIIFLFAFFVGHAVQNLLILALLLGLMGFIFSMLSLYGDRVGAIGIAGLLIMILCLQTASPQIGIIYRAIYVMVGGLWYMLLSISLSQIRPYKIIEQILGDFTQEIAAYLQIKNKFYEEQLDVDKNYDDLLNQQIVVQTQQAMLSEIIFKTRTVIKESTNKSRVLLKLYLDITELFEGVMTSYPDYKKVRNDFKDTAIFGMINKHIYALVIDLKEIGLAIKSGERSAVNLDNQKSVAALEAYFELLRKENLNQNNFTAYISLGQIITNLNILTNQIKNLHYYVGFKRSIKRLSQPEVYSSYTTAGDLRPSLFVNNLNLQSNIFRHSLRVSFSLLAGFLIAYIFNIGHSYWLLLTIVVILKPAYSLTKKRNTDRLFGTLLGIIIGAGVLYLTQNSQVLVFVMIIFILPTYIFLRRNYFVSVLFMTPYLVIFFYLLYPQSITIMLTDRLIDTAIGSAIALFSSLFFAPVWEHQNIKPMLVATLNSQADYYHAAASGFLPKSTVDSHQIKILKRKLLTNLANASDAFNRMLSEPKRYQKGLEDIHRFVVLSHIVSSHLTTISYYLSSKMSNYRSPLFSPIIAHTTARFTNAAGYLSKIPKPMAQKPKALFADIDMYAEALVEQRRQELSEGKLETQTKAMLVQSKSVIDQFNHIYKLGEDLEKVAQNLTREL